MAKTAMTTTTDKQRAHQGALKLKDAAKYLGGISIITVRRLIERGLIKPNRALRHLLIPVSELDRFLAEGQEKP
jgi:excisionase family DNA binding protein